MNGLAQFTQAMGANKFEKLEIVSDGTQAGTSIKLNGKEIPDLYSADFDFYRSEYSQGVCFNFCTAKEAKPGELRETHYFCLIPPTRMDADASVRGQASVAGSSFAFDEQPMPADKIQPKDRRSLYN